MATQVYESSTKDQIRIFTKFFGISDTHSVVLGERKLAPYVHHLRRIPTCPSAATNDTISDLGHIYFAKTSRIKAC